MQHHPIVKQEFKDYVRNYQRRVRLCVLEQYGNKCQCCGEDRKEFLGIDHINNDGAKHRKEIKNVTIYNWLRQHKYPIGFQILCHNCNMAKGFYGYCPHNKQVLYVEHNLEN